MKKTFWMVGAMTAAVAAAACSGGGSSSKGLSSGDYTISGASSSLDECTFGDPSGANGATVPVTVNGNTVTLDLGGGSTLDLTKSGTTLSAPQQTADIDWSDSAGNGTTRAYACQEHDTTDYSGTVSGSTFTLDIDTIWAAASGTPGECVAANNSEFGYTIASFPCETKIHYNFAK